MTNPIFHEISFDDYNNYRNAQEQEYMTICDHIFGSVFFWSGTYHTEIAFLYECAVLRYQVEAEIWFSFPIGGNVPQKIQCLRTLLTYCKEVLHQPLRFYVASEQQKEFLNIHFPCVFEIDSNRDRFDYVYEAERLTTLKGKKLSAKRNHIHRFEEKGEWCFEEITMENIEECWQMEEKWLSIQEVSDEERKELEAEKSAIRLAMDYFDLLPLIGGLIRLNGEVVAFTIAEQLNPDTLVIHFEKAYFNIQGSYQIINQQFLLHHSGEYRYVNREEDTGDLGLRKSKLSYYPDMLEKKYTIIESDIVYARKEDAPDIIALWNECFGDEEEYIRFYLDNRFTEENMLVIREDNHIVSMASFWDATIKQDEAEIAVKYVYAVATASRYRKKGYAARLLQHAYEKYQVPLILQPGSTSLFDYYEQLGFKKAFTTLSTVIHIPENELCTGCDCIIYTNPTPEIIKEYYQHRETNLSSFVSWDLPAITYALSESAYCGRSIAAFEGGMILYHIDHDTVHIVDCAAPLEKKEEYMHTLLHCLNKKTATFLNVGGMILCEDSVLETLVQPYLGLTLA